MKIKTKKCKKETKRKQNKTKQKQTKNAGVIIVVIFYCINPLKEILILKMAVVNHPLN